MKNHFQIATKTQTVKDSPPMPNNSLPAKIMTYQKVFGFPVRKIETVIKLCPIIDKAVNMLKVLTNPILSTTYPLMIGTIMFG